MSYTLTNHARNLDSILDEHIRWSMRVTNYTFYPEDKKSVPTMPASFENWLGHIQKEHPEKHGVIKAIDKIYSDLKTESSALLATVKASKEKPPEEQFEKFTMFVEEFANHCRRLEKNLASADFELDSLTGFRSAEAFLHDAEVELERIKRHGKEFCVVMARVGLYENIKENAGLDVAETIMKTLALLIEGNLRSFDDAYKIDENLFVLSLKQTELLGAMNAIGRIQKSMDEKKVTYPGGEDRRRIVITSNAMQPDLSDKPEGILKALKEGLDNVESDDGRILRYKEESPVDKYIRTTE
ncbi:diguanylate cyclase [Alphaproteobacteria bacterium]|nr:diguanylate cyclase [Alphaproteobacteria bacterium]